MNSDLLFVLFSQSETGTLLRTWMLFNPTEPNMRHEIVCLCMCVSVSSQSAMLCASRPSPNMLGCKCEAILSVFSSEKERVKLLLWSHQIRSLLHYFASSTLGVMYIITVVLSNVLNQCFYTALHPHLPSHVEEHLSPSMTLSSNIDNHNICHSARGRSGSQLWHQLWLPSV